MKLELIKIATNVRELLQQVIDEADFVDVELQGFPSGSCEISSVMLGLILQDIGHQVVLKVAKRPIPNDTNTYNHVWLYVDNRFTVDITADQFEDCNDMVVVSEQSDFHETFEIYRTDKVSKSVLKGGVSQGYMQEFEKVVGLLKHT
ncbi:hypothetical protein NB609_16100 [Vibrio parahaemolyticus]|uniref:hypothetical protein n=1 Tax=Vibrio TaxID=662 RepID=UPI00215D305D|nr:hypothetical protein [Vibrio parahaemolyticus]MCR9777538.1 hypothetical protein [Vibrio parahaemolyticus]MCR9844498.1 hypothetical protein [Vibrio parahaemolyticus]